MKAVVLEDRRGNRAVMADAEFTITRAVADFIAAQVLRTYEFERAGIVLHSSGAGEAAPQEAITAIAAALGKLEPAAVAWNGTAISVTSTDGVCRAVFFPLKFSGCAGGETVRSPIRAAFQLYEPAHGLQRRNEAPASYPVQAIALGRQVTILALGGEVPAGRFRAKGLLVIGHSNDAAALPQDTGVDVVVREVLARAGYSTRK